MRSDREDLIQTVAVASAMVLVTLLFIGALVGAFIGIPALILIHGFNLSPVAAIGSIAAVEAFGVLFLNSKVKKENSLG